MKFFKAAALALMLTNFVNLNSSEAQDRVSKTPSGVIRGDMNFDGSVNYSDYKVFMAALSNPAGYQATYGAAPALRGDVNDDGVFDPLDRSAFYRLFSAQPPKAGKMLIKQSELNWPVGPASASSNGRYVVFKPEFNSTQLGGINEGIIVHDSYTDTRFTIKKNIGHNFDGFIQGSVDISGNGRYLAGTGYNLLGHGYYTTNVFRYDLVTGESILIGSSSVPESWRPAISSDGAKIAFYGFDRNKKHAVYITDLNTKKTTKLGDASQYPQLASFYPQLDISGDGRYVIAGEVLWLNDLGTARAGLFLFDTLTGNKTQLSDEYGSDRFLSAISVKGNALAYLGRYLVTHLDIATGKTSIINPEGSIDTPSISADGNLIQSANSIFNLTTGISKNYPEFDGLKIRDMDITSDGQFITYRSLGVGGFIRPMPAQ